MRWDDLLDRPILLVSGKGGTGKSTVAAAVACLAAGRGLRTLLVEVEPRSQLGHTLNLPDPGFTETPTRHGFSVLSFSPREAALEYLRLFLGIRRIGRPLLRAGVLDQLIGVAPGLRDAMVCGKLYEILHVRRTNRRDQGRPLYDLVVVDAPPTGQIGSFLAAPAAVADLARSGRIRRQAAAIDRMLRRRASILLVALPEEMAAAETTEAVGAVRAAGCSVPAVVVNRSLPKVFARGARSVAEGLSGAEFRRAAEGVGLTVGPREAEELLRSALSQDQRHRSQHAHARRMGRLAPLLTLPDITGAAGPELVGALAARMAAPEGQTPRPSVSQRARGGADGASGPVETPTATLDGPLAGARIVVVCGAGGVGKTTVSAAVAIHLAEAGRRTALLTVDPARRLATALRLPARGERTVVRVGRGMSIEAIQLDTQRTFDDLVRRHAGSAERRERILSNRFYRRIADTLSGTHEYMAMEKLYELAAEEDHDAIVIDTPPTRSALSFLEAPNRLSDFLGGRLLRWMLWPSAKAGSVAMGFARFGATAFSRTVGRLIGTDVLSDVAEFLAAFEGMYAGFKARAASVIEVLRSPRCAFLVVAAPDQPSLEEAAYFLTRLEEAGMRARALVANRRHPEATILPLGAMDAVNLLEGGDVKERAMAAVLLDGLLRLPRDRAEASALSAFHRAHTAVPIAAVPDLAGDVHDVPGLRRVAARLFDEG